MWPLVGGDTQVQTISDHKRHSNSDYAARESDQSMHAFNSHSCMLDVSNIKSWVMIVLS